MSSLLYSQADSAHCLLKRRVSAWLDPLEKSRYAPKIFHGRGGCPEAIHNLHEILKNML
jgi:hypothetical protein